MFIALLKFWILGISIAAPVGPIGMLCINKTLQIGLTGTCLVGLGAALADATYGIITALGFEAISGFLLQNAKLIKIMGALILLFLAYRELSAATLSQKELKLSSKNYLKAIVSVYLLTLANPMTIMTFVGLFSSATGLTTNSCVSPLIILLGMFLGSMTWWLILGLTIVHIQKKLPKAWLQNIKYVSVGILILFAVVSFYQAVV